MFFKQLLDQESCTLTYLIADQETKEAVFIDPVETHLEDYIALLQEHGFTLKYSLETHVHADHVTASGQLRQKLGAKTAVSSLCGAENADFQMQHGDTFEFGQEESINVIGTPGHTAGSVSFLWRNCVFTGDALFIDGCGRTDFQGGSAEQLYDSITQRLFTLPDETIVYPGLDYKGRYISSIVQERTSNSRLAGKSKSEFVTIMTNLNLPKPKLIDMAVPANRYCGIEEEYATQIADTSQDLSNNSSTTLSTQQLIALAKQNITQIDVPAAKELINNENIILLDVRNKSEFEAGHIADAILMPLDELDSNLETESVLANKSATIVIYCRTGNRSAIAANTLKNIGFTNVVCITGGFEAWKQQI